MSDLTCDRCGIGFAFAEDHTEIVRRDFEEVPRPSRVEHLCAECLSAYEGFLDESPTG